MLFASAGSQINNLNTSAELKPSGIKQFVPQVFFSPEFLIKCLNSLWSTRLRFDGLLVNFWFYRLFWQLFTQTHFYGSLKSWTIIIQQSGMADQKKNLGKKIKNRMACLTTVKISSRFHPQFHLLKEHLKVLIPSRNIKIIRITFEKTMLQ